MIDNDNELNEEGTCIPDASSVSDDEAEEEAIDVTTGKSKEPISFRECLKVQNSFGSFELYSSTANIFQLAEVFMWLIKSLKNEIKHDDKTETYFG